MTNNEKIKEAKPYLQHGDIAQIAKKAQVSQRTVHRVLNGEVECPNPSIVLALLETVSGNIKKLSRIDELSQEIESSSALIKSQAPHTS